MRSMRLFVRGSAGRLRGPGKYAPGTRVLNRRSRLCGGMRFSEINPAAPERGVEMRRRAFVAGGAEIFGGGSPRGNRQNAVNVHSAEAQHCAFLNLGRYAWRVFSTVYAETCLTLGGQRR